LQAFSELLSVWQFPMDLLGGFLKTSGNGPGRLVWPVLLELHL